MKKLIFIFSLLPFLLITAQRKIDFGFSVDYSRYKYDEKSDYVEFYYSIPQSQLSFIKKGDAFEVSGKLHIVLTNDATKEDFINKTWSIPNQFKDTSNIEMQNYLIGVIGFVIPEGNYTCKVEGSDINNKDTQKDYNFALNITPFTVDSVVLSDIQLASNIKSSENNKSIFYKNSMEVIPHPINIFGQSNPVVYYYQEIYNADKVPAGSTLKVQTVISNSQGNPVYAHEKNFAARQSAMVDVGTINVSKLVSGKYFFHISVSDGNKNLAGMQKEFYVYNPSVKDTVIAAKGTGAVLSSQFAFISSEECDDYFDKAKYIASQDEKNQFKRIHTLEGKREFLYNFWNKKQSDSTQNEVHYNFSDYMKRTKIANDRYKNIGLDGWKTDRGRVYIMYGEPSEIERHPSESNYRPYEIWKYNDIESGVQFIFGDITGFSNYVLLTSDKRGEIDDPYWQERISH